MKSKYYIGKAMKKITNYSSPYREYFNEIAGFTQCSIDHFSNKKKNSRVLPKGLRKKDNYEDSMRNSKITEDSEDENMRNSMKKSVGKKKDYKILINNMATEQNKTTTPQNNNNSNSPQLIKHDYNIFINNITFKEIETSKKRDLSVQENFAKISEKISQNDLNPKKENVISADEIMISSKGEVAKKYNIKTSPIVLESENKCEIIRQSPNYCENMARLSKKEKFMTESPKDEIIQEEITENTANNEIASVNTLQINEPKQEIMENEIFNVENSKKSLVVQKEIRISNVIQNSSSGSKLLDIVSESQDSESGKSSSVSSNSDSEEKADVMEKINEIEINKNNEKKIEIVISEIKEEKDNISIKDPSVKSGSKSTNSDINRLSKISKTSLGNLCRNIQKTHSPNSQFNHIYQKIKEENDMKSCFSKPQMIVKIIKNIIFLIFFVFYFIMPIIQAFKQRTHFQ